MLEQAGYKRHEAKDLTRVYIVSVLQHPRDEKGRLRDMCPPLVRSPLEQMRDLCRHRGVPEHLVEARAKEMLQEASRSKRRGRGRRGR
jgi:hypothetical protein